MDEPRGEERPRDALTRVERQVLEWVPVSTAGAGRLDRPPVRSLHVRDTDGALHRLEAQAASCGSRRAGGDSCLTREDGPRPPTLRG